VSGSKSRRNNSRSATILRQSRHGCSRTNRAADRFLAYCGGALVITLPFIAKTAIAGWLDSLTAYSVRIRVTATTTFNGVNPAACGNLQFSAVK
jgi:hypothetical protein